MHRLRPFDAVRCAGRSSSHFGIVLVAASIAIAPT
jgi:hypothetical protein